MPVCFQLIDKTTNRAAVLPEVDNRICKELGVEPDPVKYYLQWYDAIGLRLALGTSFSQLREEWKEYPPDPLDAVLDILERDYTPNNWRE